MKTYSHTLKSLRLNENVIFGEEEAYMHTMILYGEIEW